MTKESWLNIGTVTAIAPIVGYANSFAYEAGYARYFKVPYYLISPSLTSIFISITASSVIIAFLMVWVVPVAISVPKERISIYRRLLNPFYVISFIILMISLKYGDWSNLSTVLASLIVLILLADFIVPALKYRKSGNYYARLVESDRMNIKPDKSLLGVWQAKIDRSIRILLSIVIIILALSNTIGEETAKNQRSFLTSGNYFVVKIYADTIILKDYDNHTRKVGNNIRMQKIGNENQYTQNDIGPLTQE
jgi:hypothetical protein